MDRDTVRRRRAEKLKAEKDSLGVIRDLPVACTDEAAAVAFLEKHRGWDAQAACPRCGDTDVYQMRDRATGERSKRFLWRCNGCGDQYTVRIGTIFEDSRIPLRHWCFAFWAACSGKKGVSALEIRRQTQLSYKSALFMMHRVRYAMTPDAPTAPKLSGTVEADETWIGGKVRPRSREERSGLYKQGVPFKKMRRHHMANKVPVMAMIQRDGEVRALVVPNVTARTVRAALLANVEPNARLMTDEGSQYITAGRPFADHETVTHGMHEYVRDDVSVNAAESFFSRLKRQLFGTHHAVSRKHLHRYVAEVAFKHNTRKLDDGERIAEAIRGTEGKRLLYREPTIATAMG